MKKWRFAIHRKKKEINDKGEDKYRQDSILFGSFPLALTMTVSGMEISHSVLTDFCSFLLFLLLCFALGLADFLTGSNLAEEQGNRRTGKRKSYANIWMMEKVFLELSGCQADGNQGGCMDTHFKSRLAFNPQSLIFKRKGIIKTFRYLIVLTSSLVCCCFVMSLPR